MHRQRRFRWRRQAHGRRFDRGAAAPGVLPGAVVDRTGLSALQAGLGERRPDRRYVCATEAGGEAVRACGSAPPPPPDPGRLRSASTSPLLGGLRGSGGCALEAVPCSFDLGFGGPMTPRPRLGDGRGEFGNVEPDDGAGSAMNEAGALSGVRLLSY